MDVAYPIILRQLRFVAPVFKARRSFFPERYDLRFFSAPEEKSGSRGKDEKDEAVAVSE